MRSITVAAHSLNSSVSTVAAVLPVRPTATTHCLNGFLCACSTPTVACASSWARTPRLSIAQFTSHFLQLDVEAMFDAFGKPNGDPMPAGEDRNRRPQRDEKGQYRQPKFDRHEAPSSVDIHVPQAPNFFLIVN
jgi:hypothetical protein